MSRQERPGADPAGSTECRLYEMLEAAGLMGTCGMVDLGGDGWTLEPVDPPADAPAAVHAMLGRPIPAVVPGHVHLDLIRAGIIEHPDHGDAEASMQWIGRTDWRFRRTFDLRETLAGEAVDLVCLGLDTIAEVRLDGRHVATAASMHVPHRLRLGREVTAGRHELEVTFRGPMAWAQREQAARGHRPCNGDWGPYNHVRTAACSFGWDWGPQVAGCGIWRPIRLHAWSGSRLAALRPLVVRADAEEAVVRVVADLEHAGPEDRTRAAAAAPGTDAVPSGNLALLVRVFDPDGRLVAGGTALPSPEASGEDAAMVTGGGGTTALRPRSIHAVVPIRRPRRWWPRGMGEPDRYRIDVTLLDQDGQLPLDAATCRVGLRTVALDTAPDEHGSAFTLLVNGEPVFCRGANWIPCGLFPAAVPADTVRQRVRQAADAGMNMLRVWGGGLYEQDAFYEACDAAGIMVWQDVMLACATYPEEPPYPQLIEAEVRHQVARLARHPSVVLWCGGNENVVAWRNWGWREEMDPQLTWGRRYFEQWLPRWIRETDPTRPVVPDSPWSGSVEHDPNDPDHGDRHTWDVRVEGYRTIIPRFCSELGHQSPPMRETLERAIGPEHLVLGDPMLERRQRALGGFERQYAEPFREFLGDEAAAEALGDFDRWHAAALELQARAMEIAADWHARQRPRCMGLLIWQLNDCWAGHSWSLIDVDGREKPAYHAVARIFRAMELEEREQREARASADAAQTDAPHADAAEPAADDLSPA